MSPIAFDPRELIQDSTSSIATPALIIFADTVESNVDEMVRIAGRADRLRPHCKTHKMVEVTRIELARGIRKHKCATFAEAEMLAQAGATDVLLAYNMVGANLRRAGEYRLAFPHVTFSVTADHPAAVAALGRMMSTMGVSIGVYLDLDLGQHRTGIAPGEGAAALYRQISNTAGLNAAGLHVYDGHNHQPATADRAAAVNRDWDAVARFRDALIEDGLSVPRIVAGGTPTFPFYAANEDPTIELSPGTCVLSDAGYSSMFPDLNFRPAAVLLTRVVSRPTADRITVDLGYKAVAADPPAGTRVAFLDLPDARQVLHNEEHLVLESPRAAEFAPGDELFAVPWHICPTVALYKEALVVRGGRFVDRWRVAARDRMLTI